MNEIIDALKHGWWIFAMGPVLLVLGVLVVAAVMYKVQDKHPAQPDEDNEDTKK